VINFRRYAALIVIFFSVLFCVAAAFGAGLRGIKNAKNLKTKTKTKTKKNQKKVKI
jgi:hypothetical protein